MPDLSTTVIGEHVSAVTGVYVRDGYYLFQRSARVFRMDLATSIDNTTALRSVVLVSSMNSATLTDASAMINVWMTQHGRYGDASTLVNSQIWNHDEGPIFNAGNTLGVFLLGDSVCCTFAYALTLRFYEI